MEDTKETFWHRPENEISDLVSYLIHYRELLRDEEIEQLSQESKNLLEKLESVNQAKLKEELACFRDVLALHQKRIEENDKPLH